MSGDITLEMFAEVVVQRVDRPAWEQPVKIKGRCLIGCEGRKMEPTTNLVEALDWVEYHREGFEHIRAMLIGGKMPIGGRDHGTFVEAKEFTDDTRP